MREVKQNEAHAVAYMLKSEAWKIVEELVSEDVQEPLKNHILYGRLSADDYARYTGELAGSIDTIRKIKAFASNARESSA